MSLRLRLLEARRQALVRLAARQRAELAVVSRQLEPPLRVADTVLSYASFFRRNPWISTLAGTLLGAFGLRPWGLPSRILSIWNTVRNFSALFARFRG